ncbi:MAG: hypothetical protein ABF932_14280 [Gluconobacter potus]|uniref:Uncharacterized protein n=1 Tax=Gluconobacter potus TaxID=2724927 RepID=A0ABR9YQB2_9PROT|nr:MULTISPECIES: hypothetical protein [Gluconobacter]MBF0852236.1 hypothetical protein [Gluconobacter sp. R75690]MBF0865899.1 hypothetical protein [Gluconobacter sp. R71656]MBF0868992.1 hypothetical protein [Gluconobacter sp. R75628]MBF0874963.1 hypothetical protein [Gluconobacter sp. R75629]MBF0880938.1 hypothetical protein [Gluconobacter sp. R75828]
MATALTRTETGGSMFAALQGSERGAWAHSPLFRWMAENFEAMSRAVMGKKVRWQKLCEAAAADGLTNRNGQLPKPETLRTTWYRVRKTMRAMQEVQEKAEAEAAAKKASRLSEAKASRDKEADTGGDLRLRMEQADRAERYATGMREEVRDAHVRAAAQRQERANQQAATAPEREIEPSDPSEFITQDLPVVKGVSNRAYLPVDPKLPPVREGEINRITGNAWIYGDDLPGYPSKRNYEYEKEWLRDVGLLLRHRHPTNLTMTREEKFVMRSAKSCIPNLY